MKARKKTVLIYSARKAILLRVAQFVRRMGYRAIQSTTQKQAYDIIRTSPYIDLLLCGVDFPETVDLSTLIERSRVLRPKLKVLTICDLPALLSSPEGADALYRAIAAVIGPDVAALD